MDFVVGDVVRQGFGFVNPNHAAAAICALFPFCWGWGGALGDRALPARGALQWCGRVAGVALCAMLAMTYSRTGVVVVAIEATVLWRGALGSSRPTSGRGRRWNAVPTIWGVILSVCLACIAAWWMWPRLALDGAVMNRPKIWLAGLKLFAANPLGVGFGKSGEIASALMLPDGITVRKPAGSVPGGLPGQLGIMVGLALDFKSIEDDLNELSRCIDEYGRDTVWTINLGQITYNKTYSREMGSLYVYE